VDALCASLGALLSSRWKTIQHLGNAPVPGLTGSGLDRVGNALGTPPLSPGASWSASPTLSIT